MDKGSLCSVEGCKPECYETAPRWAASMGFRVCPYVALRDPVWREVVRVHNEKEVSPLSGWPETWVAWVSRGLVALMAAQNEKAREDLEAARKAR